MRKVFAKGYPKHLLNKNLLEQLNPEALLPILARKIDWARREKRLSPLYSDFMETHALLEGVTSTTGVILQTALRHRL